MTRKIWRYTEGGRPLPAPVEETEDFNDAPRQPLRVDVSYMDGLAAPDGTDISSMAKRREYMRRNDVADAGDFASHWEKAARARQEYFSGKARNPALREAIGRAAYQLEKKGRRK